MNLMHFSAIYYNTDEGNEGIPNLKFFEIITVYFENIRKEDRCFWHRSLEGDEKSI